MANPISYLNKTFDSVLSELNLNDNFADKPDWFKRLIAGVIDSCSIQSDLLWNEAYLNTAITRTSVINFANLLAYPISPATTSSASCRITFRSNVILPVSIPEDDVIAYSSTSVRFEGEAFSLTSLTTLNYSALTTSNITPGDRVRISNITVAGYSANRDYYLGVSSGAVIIADTYANAINGIEFNSTPPNSDSIFTFYTYSLNMSQRETVTGVILGTVDTANAWQTFDLQDDNVLQEGLLVTTELSGSQISWTRVDSFLNSSATDNHYKIYYNSDGTAYIEFGNGTYGRIPEINSTVTITYRRGGGSVSNYSANFLATYGGTNTSVDYIYNQSAFTGGGDAQSSEDIKRLAPLALKSSNVLFYVEDFDAYISALADVAKLYIIRNVSGILSALVSIVPNGGGDLTDARLLEIQNELVARTLFGSISVSVVNPDYQTINISARIKTKSGYSYANVSKFAILASYLFFTERGTEFVDLYNSRGINALIASLNATNISGVSTITVAETPTVERIITNLSEPADFNRIYRESDYLGFIDTFVDGIDYVEWAGTGTDAFPLPNVTVLSNSYFMTTVGTITMSEIT